jgi:peroxin-14
MIERNKEHHTQSLNELQQEVKSLKALLLNRPTGLQASPSPLSPTARPSIPAWQLAGSTTTNMRAGAAGSSVESAPTAVSPPTVPSVPPVFSNGKGKEVEIDAGDS